MRKRAALSGSIVLLTFGSLLVVVTASCTSGSSLTDDGGEGGFSLGDGAGGGDAASKADGDSAAPPLADAPFACGNATCRVDQYCLQPCCGGPAPQCVPANDGGGCSPGFHPASCPGSGTQGCQEDPCTPPPASCIDDPQKGGAGCEQQGSSRFLQCLCA